jgi:hypothetical protein
MVEVHLSQDVDSDWEPPVITQELTYPSDDEIVPNPQIILGARSQVGTSQAPDSSTAQCLPVSGRRRLAKNRASPYDRPGQFRNIASRLPIDQYQLEQVAGRSGPDTRLKIEARRHVAGSFNGSDYDGQMASDDSDSDLSSSLEARSHSPHYSTLSPSLLSGDEGELVGINVASVNMTNEDSDLKNSEKQPVLGDAPQVIPSASNKPSTSQIAEEREKMRDKEIDELKGPNEAAYDHDSELGFKSNASSTKSTYRSTDC